MNSREKDDIIFIVLDSGDDFIPSLNKVCVKHRLDNGIIISGIGQMKKFKLGFYDNRSGYLTSKYHDPHEILHLSGNIFKKSKNCNEYEFHIHAILSNEKMETIGGHLIEGNVGVLIEIVIQKTYLNILRVLDKSSNLKKIVF